MIDLFERIVLLKRSPLFHDVATDDLRYVAQVLEEELFFEGDRVVTINEQGDHMYIVVEGEIGISINPDPKIREYVDTIGPGGFFGEMNLLDNLPRSATAHVIKDCRLLSLDRMRLRNLALSYPEISLGMLQGLSRRLRDVHEKIRQLEK